MKIYHLRNFIEVIDRIPDRIPEKAQLVMFMTQPEVQTAVDRFLQPNASYNLLLVPGRKGPAAHQMLDLCFRHSEAAGGTVFNEKGELLMIRRWDHWDLPKGKLHRKKKELPADGAIREVMEETGLGSVRLVKQLPDTHHIFQKEGVRYLKRTSWFLMTADSDQVLKPQLEEDIIDVRWVSAGGIEEYLIETWDSLKTLIRRAVQENRSHSSG